MSNPSKVYRKKSGPPIVNKETGVERQPYVFVHLCFFDGCTAWGSFGGIGCDLRLEKPAGGRWACAEHYPLLTASKPLPAQTAPVETEALDDGRKDAGDRTLDLFGE